MAATTVSQEKSSNLGIRKYFTPSNAPGLVTEYTATKTASTTSTGIMIFDTRSTPCLTPAKMTKKTSDENRTNQNSTEPDEVINSVK